MSEAALAVSEIDKLCTYPGCTRPRRPDPATGRPSRYCERADEGGGPIHNRGTAWKARRAHTGDAPPQLWIYCLSAHSLVHAGTVWLITGSPVYGFIEFVIHWVIDFAKCEKWTNFNQDQGLHLLSKVAYVGAICWFDWV